MQSFRIVCLDIVYFLLEFRIIYIDIATCQSAYELRPVSRE